MYFINLCFVLFLIDNAYAQERGHLPISLLSNTESEKELNMAKDFFEPIITFTNDDYEKLLQAMPVATSAFNRRAELTLVYCYPFHDEELLTKCFDAFQENNATGLVIPFMSEIQWRKPDSYYETLRKLQKRGQDDNIEIKIFGVAYDNPAWQLITEILESHKGLFDGLILEWVGEGACIWNIKPPSLSQLQSIYKHVDTIHYFYRDQDCETELLSKLTKNTSINPNNHIDRFDTRVEKGKFPAFLKPLFSCFYGGEGPCYAAHLKERTRACSEAQWYAWSPLDQLGGLMMHYRNETCVGIGNHVLYSVV